MPRTQDKPTTVLGLEVGGQLLLLGLSVLLLAALLVVALVDWIGRA